MCWACNEHGFVQLCAMRVSAMTPVLLDGLVNQILSKYQLHKSVCLSQDGLPDEVASSLMIREDPALKAHLVSRHSEPDY